MSRPCSSISKISLSPCQARLATGGIRPGGLVERASATSAAFSSFSGGLPCFCSVNIVECARSRSRTIIDFSTAEKGDAITPDEQTAREVRGEV